MEDTRTYTVVVTDARDIDGNPYEAASRAFTNLHAVLLAADEALDAIDVLALGASMQRQHDTGNDMDAASWLDGVVCKRLLGMRGDLGAMRDQLEVLRRASTFNPSGRIEVKQ